MLFIHIHHDSRKKFISFSSCFEKNRVTTAVFSNNLLAGSRYTIFDHTCPVSHDSYRQKEISQGMPISAISDWLSLSLSYGTNDDSFLSPAGSCSGNSVRISPKSHRGPKSPSTDCAEQISIWRYAHSGRPQNAQGPLYPLWRARSLIISRRSNVSWISKR